MATQTPPLSEAPAAVAVVEAGEEGEQRKVQQQQQQQQGALADEEIELMLQLYEREEELAKALRGGRGCKL